MGGGTGGRGGGIGGGTGGDGGTGPPQTFQRLTLCQWAVHGKNRFQMVLAPPPNRCAVALPLRGWHATR